MLYCSGSVEFHHIIQACLHRISQGKMICLLGKLLFVIVVCVFCFFFISFCFVFFCLSLHCWYHCCFMVFHRSGEFPCTINEIGMVLRDLFYDTYDSKPTGNLFCLLSKTRNSIFALHLQL